MKKTSVYICCLFFSHVVAAQVQSSAYEMMLKSLLQHSVPEIGVREAVKDSTGVVFLDAREPREYEISHLKDAVHVGYDHFDLRKVAGIPKNKRVVVYCSVGYRSEKIGEKLRAAGFDKVSNLYGGIFEWVNEGNPVYNAGGATEKVHAYSRAWGIWLKRGKKVYK